MTDASISKKDIRLATWAGTLYLLNLLLLPGLAFVLLIILYLKNRHGSPFLVGHLRQNLAAMVVSGIAIAGVSLAILLAGGVDSPWAWMVMILYGLTIHATLVLLGVLSAVKANNGEVYKYPLLGRYWS